MNWVLHAAIGLFLIACQDVPRYKSSRKVKILVPEISSVISNVTNDEGLIHPDNVEGALKFGARILDAACEAEIYNLGTQDSPDFSLPPDVYSKALCLETTYFDANERIIKVRLQPFTFKGPPAIYKILPQDNQVIDFQDVPNAVTYAYIIQDKDGSPRGFDSGLTNSLIDLKNSLPLGFYSLIVLAQAAEGKNVKAITYNIHVVPPDGTPLSLSYNLQFEKAYYQTRSIKRILIDQDVFDSITGFKVSGIDLNTIPFAYYRGGFAAYMDSDDAFMRSSLIYGIEKLSVTPLGLSEKPQDLPVTIRDFTLFSGLPAAFDDGSLSKNGLEAWTSPLQNAAVISGDSELTNGFGPMILK